MLEKLKQFISRKRILETNEGFCPQVRTPFGWEYIDENGRTWMTADRFVYFKNIKDAKETFNKLATKTHAV